MARVKYSSLVSSVSGSVGSATFQKSLYGDTLRNKPRPRRSGSPIQMERRNTMTTLHQAWQALTDAQRKQWNQFISYSSAKIRRDKNVLMTGHSLFLQYNYCRLISGLAVMADPVYLPLDPWPLITDVQSSAISFGIDFSSGIGQTVWAILKVSTPRPASQSFSRQGLRFISTPVADDTFWELTAAYLSIFGATPPTGSYIHYSIRYFSLNSPILSGVFTGVLQTT